MSDGGMMGMLLSSSLPGIMRTSEMGEENRTLWLGEACGGDPKFLSGDWQQECSDVKF